MIEQILMYPKLKISIEFTNSMYFEPKWYKIILLYDLRGLISIIFEIIQR
jgi:hypothetical protein